MKDQKIKEITELMGDQNTVETKNLVLIRDEGFVLVAAKGQPSSILEAKTLADLDIIIDELKNMLTDATVL